MAKQLQQTTISNDQVVKQIMFGGDHMAKQAASLAAAVSASAAFQSLSQKLQAEESRGPRSKGGNDGDDSNKTCSPSTSGTTPSKRSSRPSPSVVYITSV